MSTTPSRFSLNVSTAYPKRHVQITDSRFFVAALCIERADVKDLDSDWANATGVYLLIGHRPDEENCGWTAYVGKAGDGGFKNRLTAHVREKPQWQTAILFRRNVENWFNASHQAWLERAVYERLKVAGRADLINERTPSGDKHVEPLVAETLDQDIVPLIFAIASLLGYDVLGTQRGKSPIPNIQHTVEKEAPAYRSKSVRRRPERWMASSSLERPSPDMAAEILSCLERDGSGRLQQVSVGVRLGETYAQMAAAKRAGNANHARNLVETVRVLTGEKRALSPSQRETTLSSAKSLRASATMSKAASDWLQALIDDLAWK